MYAQRNSSGSRSRHGYNRPISTRLRMGLVMRRGMDFGEMGDVEGALRAQGVGLAPISTGDASLTSGGVTVLATATAADIAEGRLKGLVVPGGAADEADLAAVRSLIDLARAHSLPVIAFADGVGLAAERFAVVVEAPGVMLRNGEATALQDCAELAPMLAAIG